MSRMNVIVIIIIHTVLLNAVCATFTRPMMFPFKLIFELLLIVDALRGFEHA